MTGIPLRTCTSGRQAPSNERGHVPEERVTQDVERAGLQHGDSKQKSEFFSDHHILNVKGLRKLLFWTEKFSVISIPTQIIL